MREALILLEYQGLVRRLPNNHVRVAELSGDCLDHIFELGLALEAEVLEKWADLLAEGDPYYNPKLPMGLLNYRLDAIGSEEERLA